MVELVVSTSKELSPEQEIGDVVELVRFWFCQLIHDVRKPKDVTVLLQDRAQLHVVGAECELVAEYPQFLHQNVM